MRVLDGKQTLVCSALAALAVASVSARARAADPEYRDETFGFALTTTDLHTHANDEDLRPFNIVWAQVGQEADLRIDRVSGTDPVETHIAKLKADLVEGADFKLAREAKATVGGRPATLLVFERDILPEDEFDLLRTQSKTVYIERAADGAAYWQVESNLEPRDSAAGKVIAAAIPTIRFSKPGARIKTPAEGFADRSFGLTVTLKGFRTPVSGWAHYTAARFDFTKEGSASSAGGGVVGLVPATVTRKDDLERVRNSVTARGDTITSFEETTFQGYDALRVGYARTTPGARSTGSVLFIWDGEFRWDLLAYYDRSQSDGAVITKAAQSIKLLGTPHTK